MSLFFSEYITEKKKLIAEKASDFYGIPIIRICISAEFYMRIGIGNWQNLQNIKINNLLTLLMRRQAEKSDRCWI